MNKSAAFALMACFLLCLTGCSGQTETAGEAPPAQSGRLDTEGEGSAPATEEMDGPFTVDTEIDEVINAPGLRRIRQVAFSRRGRVLERGHVGGTPPYLVQQYRPR